MLWLAAFDVRQHTRARSILMIVVNMAVEVEHIHRKLFAASMSP